MNSQKLGFSQVELVVSLTILAIVLAICTQLFISSLRTTQTTNVIQETQSRAQVGMDRFARDFRETTITHVFYQGDPNVVLDNYALFPSPRDNADNFKRYMTGEANWVSWIAYYLIDPDPLTTPDKDEKKLYTFVRRQLYSPPALTLSHDFNYIRDLNKNDSNLREQIIAQGVYDFAVTSALTTSNNAHNYDVVLETRGHYGSNVYSFRVENSFTILDMVNFNKREESE